MTSMHIKLAVNDLSMTPLPMAPLGSVIYCSLRITHSRSYSYNLNILQCALFRAPRGVYFNLCVTQLNCVLTAEAHLTLCRSQFKSIYIPFPVTPKRNQIATMYGRLCASQFNSIKIIAMKVRVTCFQLGFDLFVAASLRVVIASHFHLGV